MKGGGVRTECNLEKRVVKSIKKRRRIRCEN